MNEKIQENDFEAIYKDTYNKVLNFIVIKCYHFDDINDILQETYVEFFGILKRKKSLKVKNIDSFICGIANNIIKRYYFRKDKLTVISSEADENIPDDFKVEEDFITKENIQSIWKYVQKRDLITVKIFYLYFVTDMKITDIAKNLVISEQTVKNKLYRMLSELKRNFGKEDFENEE